MVQLQTVCWQVVVWQVRVGRISVEDDGRTLVRKRASMASKADIRYWKLLLATLLPK